MTTVAASNWGMNGNGGNMIGVGPNGVGPNGVGLCGAGQSGAGQNGTGADGCVAAATKVGSGRPKRLHISNIPFSFQEKDLEKLCKAFLPFT